MSPQVVQLIEAQSELRGKGTEGDPYYRVTQWFRFDGSLAAEQPAPDFGPIVTADSRRPDVRTVLERWESFLRSYAEIEPGAAFDLRGDPPPWITALQRQVKV